MNIHSSLVMAVYIISRDRVGDGSGLIIKSSFNCILLHYNDVSELARLSLFLYICVRVRGGGGSVASVHLGIFVCFTPADLVKLAGNLGCCLLLPGLQWIRKSEPNLSGLWGLREVCRDACRSEDSGKHTPNPSRGLTLLTPLLFWRLQHFLVSAGVPTQGCQVYL